MGSPSKQVPFSCSRTSSVTSSSQSASTISILVRATQPRWISKRDRMPKCSFVWGMTPSSAATTSRARSMPPAPASMLRMNFSWPGTSMIPALLPSGRSK